MIDDHTKADIRKRLSAAKSGVGVLDAVAIALEYDGPQEELVQLICSEARKIGIVQIVGCE